MSILNLIIKKEYTIIYLKACLFFLIFINKTIAEPFVVLEYGNNDSSYSKDSLGDNKFINNYDFSMYHKTKNAETLSNIIYKYYGNSNLNKKIIELAIVSTNKRAFVRNNPHYMYAGKRIYLPSINEIRNLVLNQPFGKEGTSGMESSPKSDIYFFGS